VSEVQQSAKRRERSTMRRSGPHGLESQRRITVASEAASLMSADALACLVYIVDRVQAFGACEVCWLKVRLRRRTNPALRELTRLGMMEVGAELVTLLCQGNGRIRLVYLAKKGCQRVASERSIAASRRFAVLERDDFRCAYCGAAPPNAQLRVDHVVPVSKGGGSTYDNLVTACHDCNAGKGARLLGGA
jgi:hypothetical protein